MEKLGVAIGWDTQDVPPVIRLDVPVPPVTPDWAYSATETKHAPLSIGVISSDLIAVFKWIEM